MADYLTLLARRSLGMVQPMEPVRVHRYTDVRSLGGGTVAESVIGRIPAAPADMTDQDRAEPDGSVLPVRGSRPVGPSSSGAFAEVDTVSFPGLPDRPADERLNGPERLVGERRGRGQAPRREVAPADRGETGASELLVPGHSDREEVEQIHGTPSEAGSPATSVGVEGGDAVGPSPSTPDSVERRQRQPEWPAGDNDADTHSDNRAVEVAIGTIEIRAITPPPPAVLPRPQRVSPKLGLDDYLAQRRRGER